MAKYIKQEGGKLKEQAAISTSAGAGDAGKIIELDGTGRIDSSMLPVGIGADTKSIASFENLAAGDFVNIFNDAGTAKARKADASDPAKEANGFVLSAVTAPAAATVYFEGTNTQVSGLTGGTVVYLSASTPGGVTATPPSGSGNIVQVVGKAISTTEISFEAAQPIELA